MSKKKTKPEASPPPQSPSSEEHEPARPNGPAARQGWGWLRREEVEPAGAASFDNATWEESRWAP